mmetsp:Transcript_21642/g.33295  ORF Transcript_21642/g.33295 Transcript_21642/m.33295 type:complete len:92 (+) Transcript_21642:13-288(+)
METVPTDQTLHTEQSDNLDTLESKTAANGEEEPKSNNMIQDVWFSNFFEAMDTIISLVDDYPYISMDTEFPGTVYIPHVMAPQQFSNEFEY